MRAYEELAKATTAACICIGIVTRSTISIDEKKLSLSFLLVFCFLFQSFSSQPRLPLHLRENQATVRKG